MTERDLAEVFLIILREILPFVLLAGVITVISVGTICHLIAEEVRYQRYYRRRHQIAIVSIDSEPAVRQLEVSYN